MAEYNIALAGNPNVGKSTVFNLLTGLRQHTGNWPGKTVFTASGELRRGENLYRITDTPGAYSLEPRSEEEECTRECILSRPDGIIYVCDACALRRGMNLLLQINEQAERLLIVVNLMDEAKKRGIRLRLKKLSQRLGRRIVAVSATERASREIIIRAMEDMMSSAPEIRAEKKGEDLNSAADILCEGIISGEGRQRDFDRIVCGKLTAVPLMLLLLALILYISIRGANYPSEILSELLFGLEDKLRAGLEGLNMPWWFISLLTEGVYRVLAWVTAVMLPPMAIFFPLFSLAEDAGLLPRIAFNLDGALARCSACGKQALTMCMGFGCNAAGVTGCRIIESRREKLIAMLTNAFIPCNGRFPLLIGVTGMFLAPSGGAAWTAAILTGLILFSVIMSLAASKLLSKSLLKGESSPFILELPPYRRPRIWKTLLRSFSDRVIFVLGRALKAAAPAGALLWCMLHVKVYDLRLLDWALKLFEGPGRFIGLDGVILLAFVLGLPANEIVLPLMVMMYSGAGALTEPGGYESIRSLFINMGWTELTALCTAVFSLMHWPCATTLLSIKKEAGGGKWALWAALVPTAAGVLCCLLLRLIFR